MLDFGPEPSALTNAGIVGGRQLVCVQTIDIARLTTHPVVLIPGAFVAISGRGPAGDSNESGKTSFLAATGLLLSDPEWRMGGGGPASAASLLFEPETAGVAAQTYPAARHGYVVGIFAEPTRPLETALTVWCRINATAPYFLVRCADGQRLVRGNTHRERCEAADAAWDAMPSATQLGAHTYGERLYGDSPRCLAYVARRGKQKSQPSLLQMNAGSFSPEQIGDDLIRLTGRAGVFETEAQQRQRLAEEQENLATKRAGDERAQREEEDTLAGVRDRNSARRYLADAEGLWRLHFARGFLDVLQREALLDERRTELDAEVGVRRAALTEVERELLAMSVPETLETELEAAQSAATAVEEQYEETSRLLVERRVAHSGTIDRVDQLYEQSDGWAGGSAAEVGLELRDAGVGVRRSQQDLGAARALYDDAKTHLAAVERGAAGDAGATVELLRAKGIGAAALYDVELLEEFRTEWEARLALYEPAVVVGPGRLGDALAAAASRPGAILIAGEPGPLPTGIASAPDGAAGFLARLSQDSTIELSPVRAEHGRLGITVIGGFLGPQTGRSARLDRARQELADASSLLADTEADVAAAEMDVERLADDLRRAKAFEELSPALDARREAQSALALSQQAADALVQPRRVAQDRLVESKARVQSFESALRAAKDRVERRTEELVRAVDSLAALDRELENLQVEYWRSNWNDTADAARETLNGESRSEKTLRNRAAAVLQDALSALSIRSDGTGAPNDQLAHVARRRAALEVDPEGGKAPARLDEVARPLRDFLESFHDQDQVTDERIAHARKQREAELQLATQEVAGVSTSLALLQDGVEQRIRQALEGISDEYDRLNQESGLFGADLLIDARRPDGPHDRWRWSVTPRWKRSPNGRLLAYDNQSNTAQEKVATVHLVLAALLSAPNPRGRVLVLDELGDSLGVVHRRDVLSAIAETAKAKGVTVLGTCQDSVLADAAKHCGELVYFEYPSKQEALNRPTRMFGFDESRKRVELTEDDLRSGRPLI